MLVTLIFMVFGGLGLFLYGMRQMSNGLQAIAGDSLRRIINLLTTNRFVAIVVGFIITGIIQSSSVTTVMVVGFVNAGLMSLRQAIGVVMGANIGTTVTGWIIAVNITKYALPMMAVGIFMHLFTKNEKAQLYGQSLLGLGMIFFGLLLMKDGFAPLKDSAQVVGALQRFGASNLGNLLLTILVGTLITMLIQSSSAVIGIVMAMASSGLITFPTSVALVIAANVGTTITAQIASIGTNVHARRAARAHLIFNMVGAVFMLLVFRYYVQLIDWMVPNNPDLVSGDGNKPYIMAHIAMATTVFNVIMVIALVPFIGQLAAFVNWLVPQKGSSEKHLVMVDERLLNTPSLAVEQARQEVRKMGGTVREMLHSGMDLYQMADGRTTMAREIFKLENFVDANQHDITVFLAKLLQASLTNEEAEETRVLVRISDELESVGDYAENLAKYYLRMKKNAQSLSPEATEDLARISRHVMTYFDYVLDAFNRRDEQILPEAKSKGDVITEIADEIRDHHIQRFNEGTCNPQASLIFSDIVVSLRRVKNHTFNIAEAVAHWH